MNNDNPNNNDFIDLNKAKLTPKYEFYFRCRACDAILNHNSYNVKNGIQESPYCSRCSAFAFDTSDSDREYEHQGISDLTFGSHEDWD